MSNLCKNTNSANLDAKFCHCAKVMKELIVK